MKPPDRGESRHRAAAVGRAAVTTTLVALCAGPLAPSAAWGQQQEEAPEPVSLTDTIPEAVLAAMVDTGAALFNGGTCILCHAVGGRGDGRRGPDLTDVEWLHSDGSFEGVSETIAWGVRRQDMKAVTPRPFEMSPSGGMQLSSRQLQGIAAYVWTLGHGRRTPRVMALNEFLALLARGEVAEAIALFEQDRRARSDSLMLDERAMNTLGYEFLRRHQEPETAIEIFELNAELHPDSWNVWDSLAEAHMALGNRERAIELYERSLALDPENENAREMLDKLRGG